MFDGRKVFYKFIFRLQEKVREWPGEKVLLYGAGEHSKGVMEKINWERADLIGFCDRSARRQQEGFYGLPVFPPERIGGSGATKVVISSLCFQEDIYTELSGMGLDGIEVVKFYKNEDLLSFVKDRYAFRPKKDDIRPGLLDNAGKYILPPARNSHPKILLIQVPFPFGNHRHKKILPMNLLYLASYALRKNPSAMIRVLDGQVHDFSFKEMRALIQMDSWDVIGIGYWTAQAPVAYELSKFIRMETKSLLVHGGVHPTICPEEAAMHCDIMVLNEGEETFSEIISRFPDKEKIFNIAGTAYLGEKGLILSRPRPFIKDLDSLPFPAYNLVPDIKIYDAPMHVTGGLRTPLIGSRGCPYSCSFCSSPLVWNRRVRWRTPSNIVKEMKEVASAFGITQFHFWDDNIMLKRGYMEGLSSEIIRSGLKINWCGLTRSSHVLKNKDLLPLMQRSGCVGIEIGIESFSEDSSHLIRKGEGVRDMAEASRYLEASGIAPLYTHMLFNPGETITGYAGKQAFLDEINRKNTAYLADSRLGQGSTPHKKTPFENEALELGEVFASDNSHYVHQRINFIPFSLLDDIPVKIKKIRPTPMKFLEIILQAIFDWDESMINHYIEASEMLWEKIDGGKSVRRLCEEIKKELSLDDYKSKILVCLSIVGLSREGCLASLK